jgi:hypothetical protein
VSLLASLEGAPSLVREALDVRQRALDRLAEHAHLSPSDLVHRARAGTLSSHNEAVRRLADERSAAWWIRQKDASLGVLLGRASAASDRARSRAPEGSAQHPSVEVAVLSRWDGAAPRVAQALLREQSPDGIEVFRATDGPGMPPAPAVRLAVEERGLALGDDAPRSVPEGARAELIVTVGEAPRLGEEYRGKRIHLWRAGVSRQALTLPEARRLVAELEKEANCLVAEYRARLH